MNRLLVPVLALVLPVLTFAKLRDQLELLADLHPQDSVLAIVQTGPRKIAVTLADSARTGRRTVEAEADPQILARLKAGAASESVPWDTSGLELQPEPVPAPVPPAAAESRKDSTQGGKAAETNLRKNKFQYVFTQTIFSSYTYGIALPIAFEAPEKAVALGLLALPTSFGAHYYFAWNKEYQDSHLLATGYFAANSLLLSYGLPFIVLGPEYNAFRVGTFAVLAAYPAGLHYGYRHGTRFRSEPGRVSLQSSFAFVSGFLGWSSVLLWAEQVESGEVGVRLMLAQTLGAGIAGHYLSYKYRTHEPVPGGIGPGISSLSLMGGLAAGALIASVEPENAASAGALLVAGVGGGFVGGMRYFRDKYDTFERSAYNGLGMFAGAVTPLGLMLLFDAVPDQPDAILWTVAAGAAAGYAITRNFTGSLVEKPGTFSAGKGALKSFAFNPIPIPSLDIVDGKRSWKLSAPLITATF